MTNVLFGYIFIGWREEGGGIFMNVFCYSIGSAGMF